MARESDRRAHLKLRATDPDKAAAEALSDALFYALALRGRPAHLADALAAGARAAGSRRRFAGP